jgi:DNA-binding GntR family transcriptional regulator
MPLYSQVSRQLEEAIDSGALEPGYKLSNEVVLASELGVSRPTMRRAIQELVNKGLLVRKRGVGTQVVHGGVRREVRLTSLYDDLLKSGQSPTTTVLLNEVQPVGTHVAEELRTAPGTPARRIERLRFAHDEPLAILRNWLPETLLAPSDEELERHGLYELIRSGGTHLRVAHQRIGARGATAEEAKLLVVRKNSPLLTMQRTAYDDQGRVVEFGSHVYRPEAYSFELTLVER